MKLIQKLIILLLLFNKLSAQITVSHPLNSAVYQRNSASQANLVISGTYSQPLATSIQARLLNTTNGSAIPGFDWSVIQENPSMGYFQGQLNNVPAGWYTLEIRSVRSGITLEANVVNRVGIGDVFMIAGQSNGQGYFDDSNNPLGLNSNTERVVTHDYGIYCSNENLPIPVLGQIFELTKPSTAGFASWCYGRLGESLVNYTGFPVAFFNSGASGSSSENWKVSSDGGATNNIFTGFQFCSQTYENNNRPFSIGMPYSNFKRGLNYYNSLFGARAVLWHQGESDKRIGVSATEYQTNVNYVIAKSRSDFSANLPWVISRASFIDGATSGVITNAQTGLINNSNQIFAGPETDGINNNTISGSRDNGNLHFSQVVGLPLLANAWLSYLNSTFFSNSNPISANTPPNITVSYVNSTQVNLIVPGGYSSYKWVSGDFSYGSTSYGSSNTLTASSGTYRCWVTTANGNQQISSQVNVNQALVLASNGTSCTTNAYLSDLKFVSATNGLGPIELNKTNGTGADGDGGTIVLKGQNYPKGIGVADNSEIKYIIPTNQYYKFRSYVGISDDVSNACDNTGGVVFKVYGNETLLYTSPTIYRNTALQEINVNVYPYSSIKLKVEAIGSNTTCNRAVWADARLLCSSGDTTSPTVVTNLVATDTLTKCLSFQWTHATDDQAVGGYYIYKNGIIIDTIPNTQNTFTLTSLTPSTSVVFGVKAFDVVNNQSSLVTKTLSTVTLNFDYVQSYPFLCVNRSYLPINVSPTGGVFAQTEGPSASVNPSSGEFFSSNITANVYDAYQYFYIRYRVGEFIPGCMDEDTRVVGVTTQPTITPSITADKDLINQGTVVNFTSTACDANSTINWSFTAPNSTNVQYLPNSTGTYFAYCAKMQCYVYSNNLTVNVLPICSNSLVLAPTANNLTSRPNALSFNSSNTISANNTISPTNNVQYNAANSILLSPGFSVNSGVIFSAKIQNCPN
ncbi:MAG TPA: NPCBM/NEW2 domain-containing protein [Leadbetterella sp.]|nr:NPCBM/NEW2 domain-containing protein [Leadbetterella sp.]